MAHLLRHPHPTVADGAFLAFTSSLGPFAANGYVPAFHDMGQDFGVPDVALQGTLSAYLLAFALSAVLCGPLSDALGRRRVLAGGMLLFLSACAGAFFARSLGELFFWRILMGLGAGAGPVLSQAVLRDCFGTADAARLNATVAMFFALSPAVAPVLGGWMTVHWGWRSFFVFLAFYAGAIAAAALRVLPETLPPERRRPLSLPALAADYGRGLACPALLFGCLSLGSLFMGAILFIAGGADYVVRILGLGVDQFGWLSFPTVGAGLLGSWACARLLRRRGLAGISEAGFGVLLLLSAAALAASLNTDPGPVFWIAVPAAYQFFFSLGRPVLMTCNLDYFPKSRGMAASLQQSCFTAGFAVSASLWVPAVHGEGWKYMAALLACTLLSALFWAVSMRFRPAALEAAARQR